MNVRPYARVIVWALVLLLVAGAIAFALRPRPIPVETAVVAQRRIETAVEAEAKTRLRDRFVVSAQVPGRLSRITYEEGDRVVAGQKLGAIDPLPYNASIESALEKLRELQAQRAGVETLRPKDETLAQARARTASSVALALSAHARVLAAQSALEQADREARRQTALEAQGYASKLAREQAQLAETTRRRELQMAKTDAAAAEAQVTMDRAALDELTKKVRDPDYLRTVYDAQMNAIRAQLRTLEDQSSRTAIVAPVSGEIMRVLQKSEAYVGAGAPLVEIGNRNTLEIVADVLSQDAVGIHVGDTMEVLRGAGNDHPRGKVRRIEPSGYTKVSALGIEEQRVNVIADFAQRPPSLGDAYRLEVRIVTWSGNVLSVPVPALVRCAEDWCAFVVRGNKVHRTTLKIGRMGAEDAQILAGLQSGDTVVVRPPETLKEGDAVSPLGP